MPNTGEGTNREVEQDAMKTTRSATVREAAESDATTLALGAALVLADGGVPLEQVGEFARLFTTNLSEREPVLEHLEEIRIEGQQVFTRERDTDALTFDFTGVEGTREDVVLAMMTRAIELRSGRPAGKPDASEHRARVLAKAIGFAAAS